MAGKTLPENCWDNTRLIVQDSYLVKFLGKGAVEIRCPEGGWNGFSALTVKSLLIIKMLLCPSLRQMALNWMAA